MRVSRSTLKALAAITWYTGGLVLLFKGSGYLLEAAGGELRPGPIVAAAVGVTTGVLRGRSMFSKACRRNLRRIDALEDPRVWQFFRPGFFAALALMILGGAALAWVSGTGYWGLVVVGGLELVIATALLTSSVAFWRSPAPARSQDPAPPPSRHTR